MCLSLCVYLRVYLCLLSIDMYLSVKSVCVFIRFLRVFTFVCSMCLSVCLRVLYVFVFLSFISFSMFYVCLLTCLSAMYRVCLFPVCVFGMCFCQYLSACMIVCVFVFGNSVHPCVCQKTFSLYKIVTFCEWGTHFSYLTVISHVWFRLSVFSLFA